MTKRLSDELSIAERAARAMFPDHEHKWPGATLVIQGAIDTELQSLRQQLTALRDDWNQLAASSRRHASKAIVEISEMHTSDAELYEHHAGKIDTILKGSP